MNTAKRELSSQAQVAKLCRQYCKSIGVKARATSNSFSMGDSVTVYITDQPPAVRDQIETELKQYQYGSFNGMEDIYENTNRRNDIPQTKYLDVSCEYTDDLKQAAWDFIREHFQGADEHPETWVDVPSSARVFEAWASDTLYRVLHGSLDCEFWAEYLAKQVKPATVSHVGNQSAHIEQHEHTKRGFMMYMVVLDTKVERDGFNDLRDSCKELGGWYSRKWGKTPGGFAFKDMGSAEDFLKSIEGEPVPPTGGDKPRKNTNQAEKFRTMADKLDSQIADKLAPRQENTAKRQAQAAHARLEGERLKRTQSALYALADMHDNGTVPAILAGISTKKAVYDLMAEGLSQISNGYHDYSVGTGEIHDTNKDNPQAVALWALLTPKSDEEKQADDLAQKVRELHGCKIPGYFPTPDAVIDLMFDYAALQDYHAVLEPSAGSGAICDRLAATLCEDGELHCFEVNHSLRDILQAKGYTLAGDDFTQADPAFELSFDRVLMNPPFENLQDCEHVQHAFKFLKSGGRLVAVMSAAFAYNYTRKGQAFRDWLEPLDSMVVDILAGSFKESGTGVNTKLLIIDKD